MEGNRRVYKFEGEPGEDFFVWIARTEAALEAKGLMLVVMEDVIEDGTFDLDEETFQKVSEARALIIKGLGIRPLRMCLPEEHNPYKIWKMLSVRYAVVNIATRVQLLMKLSRMTHRNQPMMGFVGQFEELLNRLAGMWNPVFEEMQVAHLLAYFKDKSRSPYCHIVAAMQSADAGTFLGNHNCKTASRGF